MVKLLVLLNQNLMMSRSSAFIFAPVKQTHNYLQLNLCIINMAPLECAILKEKVMFALEPTLYSMYTYLFNEISEKSEQTFETVPIFQIRRSRCS